MQENHFEYALENGEKVQWTGQPKTDFEFTKGDVFIIPIVLTVVPIYVFLVSALISTPSSSAVFNDKWNNFSSAVIFIGIFVFAAYITFGRKFHDLYYKSKTQYVLTNKRALVFYKNSKQPIFNKSIQHLHPALLMHKDGYGTINLGFLISNSNLQYFKYGWPNKEVLFSRFENINNANEVYAIFMQAIHAHS